MISPHYFQPIDPCRGLVAETLCPQRSLYLQDCILDGNAPADSNNLVENTLCIEYLKASRLVNTLENSLS
jgi:hypothetical protein